MQRERDALCEPVQSKRMSRFHKSHLLRKFKAEMLRPKISPKREHPFCATLCEPADVKISQEPLYAEIYRKNAVAQIEPRTQTHTLREPARSTVETHVKISQEPLYAEIYSKNAAAQSEHPGQAPDFTPTVRNPLCGHTVWGNLGFYTLSCQQQNT